MAESANNASAKTRKSAEREEEDDADRQASADAAASTCLCARCQASLQAAMRPACWIPGLRNMHAKEEIWDLETTPDEAFDSMSFIANNLERDKGWHIHKMDSTKRYIQLFVYTRCHWLDVVEIRLLKKELATLAKVKSFSSGIVPVCVPLAPFLSALFCFLPFSDWGENQKRIDILRSESNASLAVFDAGTK